MKCQKFKKSSSSTGNDVIVEVAALKTGNGSEESDSKADSSSKPKKPLKTSIYRTLAEKKVSNFNQTLSEI